LNKQQLQAKVMLDNSNKTLSTTAINQANANSNRITSLYGGNASGASPLPVNTISTSQRQSDLAAGHAADRAAREAELRLVQDFNKQTAFADAEGIRKRIEALQAQRNIVADIYKAQTSSIVSELNRRLALEESIRRNGANALQTIELEAAHKEEDIRRNLATKLAQIEENLRNGTTSNRGAAGLQRGVAVGQAERDINAIRATVRAEETAQQAIRAAHTATVNRFNSDLNERVSRTRAAINIENEATIYGINSIQAQRARAAEQTRQIELRLAEQLRTIRESVSSGRVTPSQGNAAATIATNQYTTSLNENTSSLRRNEEALASSTNTQRNLLIRAAEFIGIYRVLNFTINQVSQALREIPKAGLEQQSTQASLLGIFGTKQGEENIAFIHKVANEAGQSLVVLEQAYRRYAPSAILAGAKQKEVNQSFKDFAEVGTILHLPEEKINSLFLALDQMYAKGVVQSEEVKKQLGNVLPGAVETFAISMGKTPAAFMAAMKANEVVAKDAVPIFAAYYRKIFGGPDDSVFNLVKDRLQSNLYRLETSYTDLNRKIFQDSQNTLNDIVKATVTMVSKVTDNIEGIKQAFEILTSFIIYRLVGVGIAAAIVNFELLATKISSAVKIVTGLSPAYVVAGIGVGALYTAINQLNLGYEKSIGFTVSYKDKTVSLTSYLEAFAIIAIEDLTLAFKDLSATLDKFGVFNVINTAAKNTVKSFEATLDVVYKVIAAFETLNSRQYGKQTSGLSMADDFRKNLANLRKSAIEASTEISPIVDKALKADQTALVERLNGSSYIDVWKAIYSKRLTDPGSINTALKASINIAPTAIGGNVDAEDVKGTSASTSAALSKERELLQQRLSTIAQDTILAKIKLNNKLQQLDFNQNNPKLGQSLENTVYYDKKVALNKQLLDLDVQQNKLELEANLITKSRLDLLVKESEVSLTNNANIIKAIREQESGSKERTPTSDRKVSSTGAVGSMQIFKAAWIAAGNDEKAFTKATYEELDKAGQTYFLQQLARFKDLEIALAAYKQGPTSVTKLYKQEGVDVGTITPEALTKIKAQLSDVTKTYISQTLARLPATKAENKDIGMQTSINTLEQQSQQIQLNNEQKLKELAQQRLVVLQEYRQLYTQLQSDALKAQGKTGESEELSLENKYLATKAKLQANNNGLSKEEVNIGLKNLEIYTKLTVLNAELDKINQKKSATDKVYADELNNINVLYNTGAISQFNVYEQTTKLNLKRLAELKEFIAAEKEAIAATPKGMPIDPTHTTQLKALEQEYKNLTISADTMATHIKASLGNAFDNAFTGFITGTTTAKQAFTSFVSSVEQDIAKVVADMIRVQLVKGITSLGNSLVSGLGFGSSSSTSGLTGLGLSSAASWASTLFNANGGGPYHNISQYSGKVVDKPTLFPFASGVGLMGEAGPEYIMPAKRMSDGTLGVKVQSNLTNSGNPGIIISNLSVTVPQKDGVTSQEQAKQIGSAIQMQLKTLINTQITDSTRSGGTLNPTTMAASF
jgi:tape measure domain-containing protein